MTSARGHNLETILRPIVTGRTYVLGVGNRMRGDDGAGSWLTDKIDPGLAALVVDAGDVPENHLEKLARARPETVLIVDAVDLGVEAGFVQVLRPDEVASGGLSTHALSLRMACDYLKARTTAQIYFVAIQPVDLAHAEGMSPPVMQAVEDLADALSALLRRV